MKLNIFFLHNIDQPHPPPLTTRQMTTGQWRARMTRMKVGDGPLCLFSKDCIFLCFKILLLLIPFHDNRPQLTTVKDRIAKRDPTTQMRAGAPHPIPKYCKFFLLSENPSHLCPDIAEDTTTQQNGTLTNEHKNHPILTGFGACQQGQHRYQ